MGERERERERERELFTQIYIMLWYKIQPAFLYALKIFIIVVVVWWEMSTLKRPNRVTTS